MEHNSIKQKLLSDLEKYIKSGHKASFFKLTNKKLHVDKQEFATQLTTILRPCDTGSSQYIQFIKLIKQANSKKANNGRLAEYFDRANNVLADAMDPGSVAGVFNINNLLAHELTQKEIKLYSHLTIIFQSNTVPEVRRETIRLFKSQSGVGWHHKTSPAAYLIKLADALHRLGKSDVHSPCLVRVLRLDPAVMLNGNGVDGGNLGAASLKTIGSSDVESNTSDTKVGNSSGMTASSGSLFSWFGGCSSPGANNQGGKKVPGPPGSITGSINR